MRWVCVWGLAYTAIASGSTEAWRSRVEVNSANGSITGVIGLFADGVLRYEVWHDDELAIGTSGLGFEVTEGSSWWEWDSMTVLSLDKSVDEWDSVLGEESGPISLEYNELYVRLEAAGKRMGLRFRAYDIGVAFRYEFEDSVRIVDEKTEFRVLDDHFGWWTAGDYDAVHHQYQGSPLSEIRLETTDASPVSGGVACVQTPLQMKTSRALYINIHEASLINFPAMHLRVVPPPQVAPQSSMADSDYGDSDILRSEDNDYERLSSNPSMNNTVYTLTGHLTPSGEKTATRTIAATVRKGGKSPWRTVMLTRDARDILGSRLIYALNEPCALKSTEWVRPMKYVGIWWELMIGQRRWDYTDEFVRLGSTNYSLVQPHGRHGATTERVREYIEFAAENGFDAVLTEGWNVGWENVGRGAEEIFDLTAPYPDFDIDALSQHAARRGVQLMLHHPATAVSGYERQLHRAYQFMRQYGSSVVKTDYYSLSPNTPYRLSQYMIDHYLYALKAAIPYNIHLNVHNALKPTGLSRTFPHLLAATPASPNGGPDPSQATILPFTHGIGGPIDFAPGLLHASYHHHFGSTIAYQLALYVVLYSPLQMAADLPENYARHKSRAFQFIKDVPVAWERTLHLQAEPGSHIVVARKDKQTDDWYVGAIAGPNGYDFELTYQFLDNHQYYQATVYHDTSKAHYLHNPTAYNTISQVIKSDSVSRVHIAPGGGYAAKITKISSPSTRCPKAAIRRRAH